MTRTPNESQFHLHYLANPLPDEIFASVLLRSVNRCGYWLKANTQSVDLRGHTPYRRGASLRYATHLNDFHGSFPGKTTVPGEVIRQHCTFAFLSPFVPDVQRRAHLKWALGGGKLTSKVGYRKNIVSSNFFRLCPACVEEDVERFGEPYFHRIHQLSDLNICLEHGLVLADSECDTKGFCTKSIAACAVSPRLDKRKRKIALPGELGDFIRAALSSLSRADPLDEDSYEFKRMYQKLFSFGLPTKNTVEKLLQQIESRYGECLEPAFKWRAWSRPLFYNFLRKAQNADSLPLMGHFLLLHYMGLSVEEGLRFAQQKSLWACPNGYCSAYGEFVLERIVPRKGSLLAQCPSCKVRILFSKNTPFGTIPICTRIVDPGEVLVSKMAEDFANGATIADVGRKVGLSNAYVVSIARNLGIIKGQAPRDYYPKKYKARLDRDKLALLSLIKAHPDVIRRELVKLHPTLYRKLQKEAPEWFEANMPKARPRGSKRLQSWPKK